MCSPSPRTESSHLKGTLNVCQLFLTHPLQPELELHMQEPCIFVEWCNCIFLMQVRRLIIKSKLFISGLYGPCHDFSIRFMKQHVKFVTISICRDRLVCYPLPYLSWIAKTPLGFTIITCHQPVPRPVWSDNGNTAASCFWRTFAFCISKGELAISIRKQRELIKQSSNSHPIAWLKRTLKIKVSYSRPQKTKSLRGEMRGGRSPC